MFLENSSHKVSKPLKLWATFVGVFSLVLSVISPFSEPASAADLSKFRDGNIISDSVFFDGNAMTALEVQRFLDARLSENRDRGCTIGQIVNGVDRRPGAPYVTRNFSSVVADSCLNGYYQQTPNMAAQPGACSAYQGSPRESAAEIIAKVGKACNISQKVLLVLLQKEQGLIYDSWPVKKQLDEATGFDCYDNGLPCVGTFAGFFYQVWAAARQFQRYGTAPFTYFPVRNFSSIAYKDNAPWCGTKLIFIENRATAALYYYTPYTPNQASLNAGYGLGDSCSTYGNRNFYQQFVDWFGTTHGIEAGDKVSSLYNSLGGVNSWLGAATRTQFCGLIQSGCYQHFTGGSIYWTPTIGAVAVRQEVRTLWANNGWELGAFGYPTAAPTSYTSNTYSQTFQNGTVNVINGVARFGFTAGDKVSSLYNSLGGVNSWLGAATRTQFCGLIQSGCYQHFTGGSIYWTPTIGAVAVRQEVRTLWANNGWELGAFGYPTAAPTSYTSNTYSQTFQNGTVNVINGVARFGFTAGDKVSSLYNSLGGVNSWLGAATRTQFCGLIQSGCYQHFTGGSIYWTPTIGAVAVRQEVRTLWANNGWELGAFGYPTAAPTSYTSNTYSQTFQNGTVNVINGVARFGFTAGDKVSSLYNSLGGVNSWLGAATRTQFCGLIQSGCYQHFTGGSIYWTPTIGAVAVRQEVRTLWANNGWELGAFGYPTAAPTSYTSNTYSQTFQNGTVNVINGVARFGFTAGDKVSSLYNSLGGVNSWLGAATRTQFCGLIQSGCYQHFTGGSIYWTPTIGAVAVRQEVRTLWANNGWELGAFGYPTAAPTSYTSNTYSQTFQNGTVNVINGVARFGFTAGDKVSSLYNSLGGVNSWLGAATRTQFCGLIQSGCYQHFTGGSIYWTPTIGAVAVRQEVRTLWANNGWELGAFGYPTAAPTSYTSNTYSQTFQNGTVNVINGVARFGFTAGDKVSSLYNSLGGVNSWLGAATRTQFCGLIQSGCYQHFTGGSIYWTPTIGAVAVRQEVRTLWANNGWELGAFGYPTAAPTSYTSNTYSQTFQNGTVNVINGVARFGFTAGDKVSSLYNSLGGVNSWLGAATRTQFCGLIQSGCYQHFTGGSIYWTPTIGAVAVRQEVRTLWANNGWELGAFGYPTAAPTSYTSNTYSQTFQNGTVNVINGVARFGS